MIQRASPQAPESLPLDDVITGIVRLPLPTKDRIALLHKLYDATAKIENGMCVIEGPFREELHTLFSERRRELSERLTNIRLLRERETGRARLLGNVPLEEANEEELAQIVEETRGDFDALETKLSDFEKKYREDIEAEVKNSADAAGIEAARDILKNTDGGTQQLPKKPGIYDQLQNPPMN